MHFQTLSFSSYSVYVFCIFIDDLLWGQDFPVLRSDPNKPHQTKVNSPPLSITAHCPQFFFFFPCSGKTCSYCWHFDSKRFGSWVCFLVSSLRILDRVRWCPLRMEIRWTWRPSVSLPRSWLLPSPVSSTLPRSCPCFQRYAYFFPCLNPLKVYQAPHRSVSRWRECRVSPLPKAWQGRCSAYEMTSVCTASLDTSSTNENKSLASILSGVNHQLKAATLRVNYVHAAVQ